MADQSGDGQEVIFASVRLTKGRAMKVDPEDVAVLAPYTWFPVRAGRNCYAAARIGGERVYADRVIARALAVLDLRSRKWRATGVVDHINGDGLDNRKANLRLVTAAQNAQNSRGRVRHRVSRFKGVSFYRNRADRPWRATIEVGGRQRHLGYFATEAALAYNAAAVVHFGPFAFLNAVEPVAA